MKLSGNFEEWTVTQALFGQILGLTPGRISQLADEQIVVRNDTEKGLVFLIESLRNYYLSKKSRREGRVDYWEERGLHERAKRKLAELKLKKAKGEVYNAKDVENAFISMLTILRNNLLSLPNKFAVQLEGKNCNEIFQILNEEISMQLEEISKFDVSTLSEDIEEDDNEED